MEFAKTTPRGQTPRDLNHVLVQTAWFKIRLKLSAQASIHTVHEVERRTCLQIKLIKVPDAYLWKNSACIRRGGNATLQRKC